MKQQRKTENAADTSGSNAPTEAPKAASSGKLLIRVRGGARPDSVKPAQANEERQLLNTK